MRSIESIVSLVEQLVRTAQIGVYEFLDIDKEIHPVFVGTDDGTFWEKLSAGWVLMFKWEGQVKAHKIRALGQ
jgi:myosin-crossreactive antigen